MPQWRDLEIWFVTGSQSLYGEDVLKTVAGDAKKIAQALDEAAEIPVRVVSGPVVTTSGAIKSVCQDANASDRCIGIIFWMHTFSPAKMWIAGLRVLNKPFCHLHTQHNRDIPWSTMDMEFMNLNQSAHGGREFGHVATRLNKRREVIVGHWSETTVREEIGRWSRAAAGWRESANLKVARFGDNMREVAVTEGDKVTAQARFGFEVDGYATGDLVSFVEKVSDSEAESLARDYEEHYEVSESLKEGGDQRVALLAQARIELGLEAFLNEGGYSAFTTNFEQLHGLAQLPGLAAQRLMAKGYGFGAEGDWKTAALLRIMKVMGSGIAGGTSFMEDYTYHMDPSGMMVLGAHMLEVCPTIASSTPRLEIHPLAIGGRDDPPRLVFGVAPSPAINVTLIDLGDRFRMIANQVEVIDAPEATPNLPVARAVWKAAPDLKRAAACWILAGGAHHTVFTTAIPSEMIETFADIADVELLLIDADTTVRTFKRELRWNEAYYRMPSGRG